MALFGWTFVLHQTGIWRSGFCDRVTYKIAKYEQKAFCLLICNLIIHLVYARTAGTNFERIQKHLNTPLGA